LQNIFIQITLSLLKTIVIKPGPVGQPGTRGLNRVYFIHNPGQQLARRKPFDLLGQLGTWIRVDQAKPGEDLFYFLNVRFEAL